MNPHRGKKLGRIFVELGVLNGEQEKAALACAKERAIPFGQACVALGFVTEETVVRGLSMQLGAPSVSLQGISVSEEARRLIPARLAERERVVPVSLIPAGPGGRVGTLVIAIASPKNLMELDELSFITGCRISAVIASDSDIDRALLVVYGIDSQAHTRAHQMVDPGSHIESLVESDDLPLANDPLDFLPTVDLPAQRSHR